MSGIRYSNVITHLFLALPEILGYYDQRASALYADGNAHVTYGSILVEFINSLRNRLEGQDHIEVDRVLKRAFALIEELSSSDDFETRSLVETSVLEALLGEQGDLERFASYMGRQTKELAAAVAREWGLNTDLLS